VTGVILFIMKTKFKYYFEVQILIILFFLIGEVKCILKMINCNWEPVGKAEIIYTVGSFTGLGSIIGYLDIKDN